MNLTTKTIVVTGSNGFLGQHVCNELRNHYVSNKGELHHTLDIFTSKTPGYWQIRSLDFDLTKPDRVAALYDAAKPDIIIHLAAVVGGIAANRKSPGTFYYKNLMMGTLLLEEARKRHLEKFVTIGTVCSYPKHTPVPFDENDLWNGYPEETNAPYGIAKKALLVQGQAYRKEFGLESIHLMPVNLYGPGDNFDPESSHVIPALIKKCIDARNNQQPSIECWGTGAATREFLYVEDAAKAIIQATQFYNNDQPINIGSGTEVSIKDLVVTIAKLCKFTGTINWNDKYPDGQPRRCLNTNRARQELGFEAKTELEDGLTKTINWYENLQ